MFPYEVNSEMDIFMEHFEKQPIFEFFDDNLRK